MTLVPTTHLTDDQFAELLAARTPAPDPSEPSVAHLASCSACASELNCLRQSLALFQEASVALADHEFGRQHRPFVPIRPVHPSHLQTTLWATAAAVLLAALLPFRIHWQSPLPAAHGTRHVVIAHNPESDEALLEDVDRDINASVPAPMQALADPAGSFSSAATQTASSNPDQRKD